MITAWWAIARESYRYLLARKLFWITLGVSILVALLFGSVGVNERGVTWWYGLTESPNPIIKRGTPEADFLVCGLFSHVVVKYWLAWLAAVLALISTTAVFPDFMQPGSIDLALAKPNSRVSLFFAKYFGSLLFVTLQVAVFCAIYFILLGWRAGVWRPSLFWAVPIVVGVFSFVFSLNVLFGVWTRSALAALLLSLLAWGGIWGVQVLDQSFEEKGLLFRVVEKISPNARKTWRPAVRSLAAIVPKTQATTDLLPGLIVGQSELSWDRLLELINTSGTKFSGEDDPGESEPPPKDQAIGPAQPSLWWTLLSSLFFEGLVLAAAAWIFHRRDF